MQRPCGDSLVCIMRLDRLCNRFVICQKLRHALFLRQSKPTQAVYFRLLPHDHVKGEFCICDAAKGFMELVVQLAEAIDIIGQYRLLLQLEGRVC